MPRALELGDDVVEVQVGAAEGALQVVGVGRVPAQLLIDRLVLGFVLEPEAGAHAIEQIGVLRRREAGDLRRTLGGRLGRGIADATVAALSAAGGLSAAAGAAASAGGASAFGAAASASGTVAAAGRGSMRSAGGASGRRGAGAQAARPSRATGRKTRAILVIRAVAKSVPSSRTFPAPGHGALLGRREFNR